MRDEWGIVRGIAFFLFGLFAFPDVLTAQVYQALPKSPITVSGDRVPEGVYIMPWVAAGVLYDDNVFFSLRGNRQDDVFYRVTPGLQASYRSTPFTVIADYRFDSEVYNKLTQLNTVQQRQFGTLEIRGRPSTNWTVGNIFGYGETKTPFELNILTSAQVARFKSERYYLNPSTEYRFDASTRATAQYAYSHDNFADVLNIDSHVLNLGLDRRVSPHDTIGPAYVGRHFTFGGDLNSTVILGGTSASAEPFTAHAFMLAWTHEFSAETRLDMRAGPRISNGRLDDFPELFVSLRRRIQGGDLSLTYTSTVTTIIGTVGSTRADSVIASMSYEPVKHFTFTAGPLASWIKSSTFDSTVYTAYLEGAYQFNRYVTAKASAYFSYQEGNFRPIGGATVDNVIIPRNVYWLRLEFAIPYRWE
ncbi:MAG: hypothetical protein ICV75_06110 [Nitrospiraceae bacterium]|nr:hypothetical protein [Nitrospiraceae bacterium]